MDGVKCQDCGAPASLTVAVGELSETFCETCAKGHSTYFCRDCGAGWWIQREYAAVHPATAAGLCSSCFIERRLAALPDPERQGLSTAVMQAPSMIKAILAIRELFPATDLRESTELAHHLRKKLLPGQEPR